MGGIGLTRNKVGNKPTTILFVGDTSLNENRAAQTAPHIYIVHLDKVMCTTDRSPATISDPASNTIAIANQFGFDAALVLTLESDICSTILDSSMAPCTYMDFLDSSLIHIHVV